MESSGSSSGVCTRGDRPKVSRSARRPLPFARGASRSTFSQDDDPPG